MSGVLCLPEIGKLDILITPGRPIRAAIARRANKLSSRRTSAGTETRTQTRADAAPFVLPALSTKLSTAHW